jgi:hypothetical protein
MAHTTQHKTKHNTPTQPTNNQQTNQQPPSKPTPTNHQPTNKTNPIQKIMRCKLDEVEETLFKQDYNFTFADCAKVSYSLSSLSLSLS